MITYIKGYAAKLEAEKIKERTVRGRKARVASGRLACWAMITYQERGEGEGVRQINSEQAKVVKDVFSWFISEHLSLDRIVYRLRELGIPSPRGNPMWAKSSVVGILKNSDYCGGIGNSSYP